MFLQSTEDTTNQWESDLLMKIDRGKRPYTMIVAKSIVVAGITATIAWIALLAYVIKGLF
jgi:hypothetical protein